MIFLKSIRSKYTIKYKVISTVNTSTLELVRIDDDLVTYTYPIYTESDGDYNSVVKFNRADVANMCDEEDVGTEITLTFQGKTNVEDDFEGSDDIRVIYIGL